MGPTGTLTFTCSICAEPSHDICVYCTKDVCRLHRCQRCLRCSDCCECESPLCLDEEPVAELSEAVAGIAEPPDLPVDPAFEPAQPAGDLATESDPTFPGEHLPGTSTNGEP